MNNVNLIGRLVREVEATKLQTNTIANFDLAVDAGKDKNGNKHAYFFKLVAFGKTAELLQSYTKKGDQIGVTGKLTQRSYTAKDNSTRYVIEIVVEQVDFLTPKATTEQPIAKAKTPTREDYAMEEVDATQVDELPFQSLIRNLGAIISLYIRE